MIYSLKTRLLSIIPLAIIACSSAPQQKEKTPALVQFETKTWLFERTEVLSENYPAKIPACRLIHKESGKVTQDFSRQFEAFEWVLARETPQGTIAALDHGIEGRSEEIPIIFYFSNKNQWEIIAFKKPNFAAEVIQLDIQPNEIRLRLELDPAIVNSKWISNVTRDPSGATSGFSDWSYSFQKKKWNHSKRSFVF
jgi:hypothetical protein